MDDADNQTDAAGLPPQVGPGAGHNRNPPGISDCVPSWQVEPGDDLVRAARIAAVGRLASRLSAELRQPLGVIRNSVYFLNIHLGTSLDDKVRRHLGIMLHEVENVTRITTNLASLTATAPPQRELADLELIVTAALESVEHPASVRIEHVVPPHTVLFCDPNQMRPAISNIVVNGIQAMPDGGTVRVVCRKDTTGLTIEVADTGAGMDEAVRKRVFEPLFTTSQQRLGLGMTVVRTLVGANGGTVEVASEPGKGTKVSLRFPTH
jgi:two-component system sensor histidine kinase AtoS